MNIEQEKQELLHSTLSDFQKRVALKYRNRCLRLGQEPTLEGLVAFMAERHIVRPGDAVKYMVYEYYPKAMYECDGVRRHAVYQLEYMLPVSERTIWRLLKNRPFYQKK